MITLVDKIESLRTPLRVTEVRYGKLGKIIIRLDNGSEFTIREPRDVLLVGVPLDLVSKWVNRNYGALL